jgi:hypothetical protein
LRSWAEHGLSSERNDMERLKGADRVAGLSSVSDRLASRAAADARVDEREDEFALHA